MFRYWFCEAIFSSYIWTTEPLDHLWNTSDASQHHLSIKVQEAGFAGQRKVNIWLLVWLSLLFPWWMPISPSLFVMTSVWWGTCFMSWFSIFSIIDWHTGSPALQCPCPLSTPGRDTLDQGDPFIWDQLAQEGMLSRVPISAQAQCNDRLPTRVAFILEKSIDACFLFLFFPLSFSGVHLRVYFCPSCFSAFLPHLKSGCLIKTLGQTIMGTYRNAVQTSSLIPALCIYCWETPNHFHTSHPCFAHLVLCPFSQV